MISINTYYRYMNKHLMYEKKSQNFFLLIIKIEKLLIFTFSTYKLMTIMNHNPQRIKNIFF